MTAELRRDPERSRCILVAVSGYGKDSLPSPSPFDGYFVKPLDFASLLAYLSENCCGRGQSCAPACNPADDFMTGDSDEALARSRVG